MSRRLLISLTSLLCLHDVALLGYFFGAIVAMKFYYQIGVTGLWFYSTVVVGDTL